jgi:hypothetical protein
MLVKVYYPQKLICGGNIMATILAAVTVRGATVVAAESTPGTAITLNNNGTEAIVDFPNANNHRFVAVISHFQNFPYTTSTHWIKNQGANFFVVGHSAMDTSGRIFAVADFNAIVVAL